MLNLNFYLVNKYSFIFYNLFNLNLYFYLINIYNLPYKYIYITISINYYFFIITLAFFSHLIYS